MSEYKWGDPDGWDTFCYVEKGSEKLGFFQTYLELKDLQRQLAEVRKENGTLINKNILLAEGNSILMQQLREKNNVHK